MPLYDEVLPNHVAGGFHYSCMWLILDYAGDFTCICCLLARFDQTLVPSPPPTHHTTNHQGRRRCYHCRPCHYNYHLKRNLLFELFVT